MPIIVFSITLFIFAPPLLTSVTTEDFVVYNCSQWQDVEAICERLPQFYAVTSYTYGIQQNAVFKIVEAKKNLLTHLLIETIKQ